MNTSRNKTGRNGTYTSQGFVETSTGLSTRYETKSNAGFYLFMAGLVAGVVGLISYFI